MSFQTIICVEHKRKYLKERKKFQLPAVRNNIWTFILGKKNLFLQQLNISLKSQGQFSNSGHIVLVLRKNPTELSVILYILHGLTNVNQVADGNYFLKCCTMCQTA